MKWTEKNRIRIYFLFFLLFVGISIEVISYFFGKNLIGKGLFYDNEFIEERFIDYKSRVKTDLGWDLPNRSRVDLDERLNYPLCIDVYGDSFTFGVGVDDERVWSALLQDDLKCTVRNFGVGGFGSDQAFLKFQSTDDSAQIVILNHLSENIVRNVNQLRNLIYPSRGNVKLKPRFVLDKNGALTPISIPEIDERVFNALKEDPSEVLDHEYFLPGGDSGLRVFEFPYSLGLLLSYKHWRVAGLLKTDSSFATFYQDDHQSKALHVTRGIFDAFQELAKRRNLIALAAIFPLCEDFAFQKKYGFFPYRSLEIYLRKTFGSRFIDYGREILGAGVDVEELYDNKCKGHFNNEGNLLVSQILKSHLTSLDIE